MDTGMTDRDKELIEMHYNDWLLTNDFKWRKDAVEGKVALLTTERDAAIAERDEAKRHASNWEGTALQHSKAAAEALNRAESTKGDYLRANGEAVRLYARAVQAEKRAEAAEAELAALKEEILKSRMPCQIPPYWPNGIPPATCETSEWGTTLPSLTVEPTPPEPTPTGEPNPDIRYPRHIDTFAEVVLYDDYTKHVEWLRSQITERDARVSELQSQLAYFDDIDVAYVKRMKAGLAAFLDALEGTDEQG